MQSSSASEGKQLQQKRKAKRTISKDQPTMTSAEARAAISASALQASSISSGMRFTSTNGTNSPVRKKQKTSVVRGGRKRITPVLIVESAPKEDEKPLVSLRNIHASYNKNDKIVDDVSFSNSGTRS